MNMVQYTFLFGQIAWHCLNLISIFLFAQKSILFPQSLLLCSLSSKFTFFYSMTNIFTHKKNIGCIPSGVSFIYSNGKLNIKSSVTRSVRIKCVEHEEIAAGRTVRIPICIWTDGIDAINKFADTLPKTRYNKIGGYFMYLCRSVFLSVISCFCSLMRHSLSIVRLLFEFVCVCVSVCHSTRNVPTAIFRVSDSVARKTEAVVRVVGKPVCHALRQLSRILWVKNWAKASSDATFSSGSIHVNV